MNKKGFTLIELLAVIIILGILMIIAIPSVTKYISDSRKNSYVDTAKEVIGSARNLVNSGSLEMYDTDATYYIDVNCINTENALKSPYGDFTNAYVVVTYDGKGYDYFWTSVDDAGQGVKNIVKYDKLDTDNIESDLSSNDISTLRGIDGRSKTIVVSETNNCKKQGATATEIFVNGETGEEINPVEYPDGKTKATVEIGEIVTIGTEEFFVIGNSNNELTLFAKYNLKVGNIYSTYSNKAGEISDSEPGYGIQSSEAVGRINSTDYSYGTIEFASSKYWVDDDSIRPEYQSVFPNIYDINSTISPYLNNYKTYLERYGVKIKNIRLLYYDEYNSLKSLPNIFHTSSYWLGSSSSDIETVRGIKYNSSSISLYSPLNENLFGIRAVIII